MVYFNAATKEITAKLVYYGPGMCGKTTNLQKVHELMRPQMKSDLVSVATETDRTIYFDFLPLKLGKIAGFDFVVRTFTVPGQPYYAETRKMVLQGADGVVFVADSQRYMLDQNKDSLRDLRRNLKLNGIDYRTVPLILQYNKRDLPDVLDLEDLDSALNERNVRTFAASALTGAGVVETLKAITLKVFKHVRDGGMPRGPSSSRSSSSSSSSATAQSQSSARRSRSSSAASEHAESKSSNRSPPPPLPASLAKTVEHVVQKAEKGAPPMPSRESIGMQEFQNLAVLHHKLAERVAQLESELSRVTQDHQDLKRVVGRKLL